MSYWAVWANDFPHWAVAISEAVVAFCITWRLTRRRPVRRPFDCLDADGRKVVWNEDRLASMYRAQFDKRPR